ncbi:MAG TPA: lysophospholipid acyltransferase family protein [Steroidobacteraceae bacterium]|nr:lysophospholipid acyltransferase family protein [Steroidobacteraceae bacterium]
MRIALQRVFGVYCWVAFFAIAILTLVLVLITPGMGARRATARAASWSYLWVSAVRCRVLNEARLPAGPCIVVANHTSYIDGVVMMAVLPPRFSFVIKKEMNTVPLANWLLRRIGSEFVERYDRHKGALDARRVLRAAERGQALAFFPEGTFSRERGLLRFHNGAFSTAARMNWPLVPAVIRGAREVMPAHRAMPVPGSISVDFIEVLQPGGADRHSANRLRDRCRADILAALGEPDLA